ncbi:MAG: hypothetical protein ACK5L8_03485 [Marinicella pacifica]
MKTLKALSAFTLFSLCMTVNAQTCPATPDAWDVTDVRNGGGLSITNTGAAGTDCKLTVTSGPNSNGIATVHDDMPSAETSYRARFYVDASNVMANSTAPQQRVKSFVALNLDQMVDTSIDIRARPALLQMFIVGEAGNAARLGGFCRDLNSNGNRARFGGGSNPGNVSLQSGWNVIEVEIKVGAGTGECRIWVNNNVEASPDWEQTGMDNALMVGVKRANIGIIGSTPDYPTVLGSEEIHYDEFESRRQTFIGSN